MRDTRSPVETSARLVDLIYELMDAHDDTARVGRELPATGSEDA